MDNIRDIKDNLEQNIDISKSYKPRKIKISWPVKKTINDIRKNLKWTIDLGASKYVKVFVNNTKNYDSILKDKRLKDINLVEKKSLWYRLNQKNIFEKKNIFTKKNSRKISYVLLILICIFIINASLAKYFINSWYKRLLTIQNNVSNISEIRKTLRKTRFDFVSSAFLFKPLLLIPNENIKNWNYIIKWWRDLVVLWDNILSYYSYILELIDSEWIENIDITDVLNNSKPRFYDFSYLLSNIIYSYDQVWNIWNKDLENKFIDGKEFLHFAYSTLTIINRNFDIFLNILWASSERKYLILLQNNDEIRPTWGFIWSIWMVKVYKWKILELDFQDTYAFEWDINKVYLDKIPSPKWIDRVTKFLWFRDANYKIDFSDSSKEIKFFTDKIDAEIDGIIYMNQSVVLDLLKVTWDLQMNIHYTWDNITQSVGEQNFSEIISTLVEAKTSKIWTLWTPKKILFDFSEVLFSELKNQGKYSEYMKVLINNITSRDLVINSFHPDENSLIWKLWLNGDVSYWDTLDYTYPVYTSIWWWKTDRYYKREYKKIVNTNIDCSIDTKLEITWFHLFTKKKEDEILELMRKYNVTDKNILFIQWKTDNKSYVRVLLPKNAIIEKNKNISISELDNHQLVEFYTNTRRLEKVSQVINYTLPNKSCEEYSFKLYKQPGIRSYDIQVEKDWYLDKKYWIEKDYYYNSSK